jgi:hypothetical protein
MPSLTPPFRAAANLAAQQCRRLHAALEALAGEVRAAIARAVGQATGEAVREALRVILDGPPGADNARDRREGLWASPRRRPWPAQPDAYGPEVYDPYERDSDVIDDALAHRPLPADESVEAPAEAERPGAWSRAVAAGCQAAGWWLRRHPGRFALVAAAAIGVAAGVLALVGGRFVAAGAAALGVLALADAAWSVAGLAAGTVK